MQQNKRTQAAEAERDGTRDASRERPDRKSTRLNSSHSQISYAVFCLKKKKKKNNLHAGRSTIQYRRIVASGSDLALTITLVSVHDDHGLYTSRPLTSSGIVSG